MFCDYGGDMTFDPFIAATRFGTGLSPIHALPASVADVVADLQGVDTMAREIIIAPFATATPSPAAFVTLRRAERAAETEDDKTRTAAAVQQWRADARTLQYKNAMKTMARSMAAPLGLRERLTAFWADHFTAKGRNSLIRPMITPFIEEAIRPHITGSFVDMLIAVATHPVMLHYLQQVESHGPASPRGLRRGKGLNENLAREMLELHSLGVEGRYEQTDVRELAELLTGLTYHPLSGFTFDDRMAEPGAETVLGISYGPAASLNTIQTAIADLATHPDTSQHIARKLVVHFISDQPDEALVASIAQVFQQTDGDLLLCMMALLDHPAAWTADRAKVRPPIEFITASFRALNVSPEAIITADQQTIRRWIERPLRIMGQPFQDPVGPDGWPERPQEWIIPQTMAGRISWAMRAPKEFTDPLPDPRDFVRTALGNAAPKAVIFAATSAERRSDGIGIILSAPAFQRR
ncbi:MAG: hypothetical protein ACI9ND_000755 [Yoonia sp.]|jgi:uncharacterized protein (DUF1800 family)